MSEVTYTDVVWTAGDTITEAKLDNMTANDRAVDAMYNGVMMTERADPDTPDSNKLHMFAKDKDGVSTLYVINDAGDVYELSEGTPTYMFPISYPYVTSLAASPIPVIKDCIITEAFAYAGTGPDGADLIFDINKNGTSIWTTTPEDQITIADGDQTGVQTSFHTTDLAKYDILTIDVDQVGSNTAGQDVIVYLKTK